MEDDSIDTEDDSIDMEDDHKMTVSIWEMTISIWDILSLWPGTLVYYEQAVRELAYTSASQPV
jgi:hypothetical protein